MNQNRKILIISLVVLSIIIILITALIYSLRKQEQKNKQQQLTEKNVANLSIRSSPNNISVSIGGISDDDFLQETATPMDLELKEGKYLISAYKENYDSRDQEIEIKTGDIKTINIKLNRIEQDITEGAP